MKHLSIIAVTMALSIPPAAMADTAWQQAHPRREQVNGQPGNRPFKGLNHQDHQADFSVPTA